MKGIQMLPLAMIMAFGLSACTADGNLAGGGGGGGSGVDPDISATDDDGDGVANDVDLCPNTGPNLIVDANGCSIYQRDSDGGDANADGQPDGDGVADANDLCPGTTAEQAAAGVDSNGCSVDQYGVANPLPSGFVCTDSKTGDADAGDPPGNPEGTICLVDGLLGPEVFTTVSGEGACIVRNEDNAVDGNLETFADMEVAGTGVGLVPVLGESLSSRVSFDVISGAASTGVAGDMVAFVVEYPAANAAEVGLLEALTFNTYNADVLQESFQAGEELQLALLSTGVIAVDEGDILVGFLASLPYDRVEVVLSGDLLVTDLNVFLLGDAQQVLHVKSACADAVVDPASQVAP